MCFVLSFRILKIADEQHPVYKTVLIDTSSSANGHEWAPDWGINMRFLVLLHYLVACGC